MASVNQETVTGNTQAKELLDYALGQKRIKLGDLSGREFDEFLRATLKDVDLRELRGFKSLREFLTFHTRDGENNVFGTSNLELHPDVSVTRYGFDVGSFSLDTHVLMATREMLKRCYTFRRYETGEETNDLHVMEGWGDTCYLARATMETLVIRRPRDHSSADANLVFLRYSYQKVPNEKTHLIIGLTIRHLPISEFRTYFGDKYAETAIRLLWALSHACSYTHRELVAKAESFGEICGELEHLTSVLSY